MPKTKCYTYFLPWGLNCVELFRGCLGYTLCFLCLAKMDLVIGSDGQRTACFKYGERSVADSRCTMAR